MKESQFRLGLLDLPESPDLGVRHLSGIFRHTTNSYKYYWFLAILEAVKNGFDRISLDLLTAEMIAQVWYPVHYFKLNFGKLDKLNELAFELLEKQSLSIQSKREEVRDSALSLCHQNKTFFKNFKNLQRYVPTRFLTPWFELQLRGVENDPRTLSIIDESESQFYSSNAPLYHFIQTEDFIGIELHSDWMNYLEKNFRIVRGFVLWHLIEYLQKRNPNVPNLPEKLFPPQNRELSGARKYWKYVMTLSASETWLCPYSNYPVNTHNFSLDHFLPWSFVCHDQLWNLIPVSKAVNSSKSDALPDLKKYLPICTFNQYRALRLFLGSASEKQMNWIEDYLTLCRLNLEGVKNLDEFQFEGILKDTFQPLEQIAANMGFKRNWVFSK